MKFKILSLLLTVFAMGLANTNILAQVSVSGKIYHKQTGEAIPFANVVLNDEGQVSDRNGSFLFSKVAPGDYTLKVSFVGFKTYTTEINVNNVDPKLEIRLEPTIITAEEVVISATKTKNLIKEIPTRVHLISPLEINSLPVATTDELLNFLPGVNINRSFGIFSHKATVSMRGLSGKEQGRVLVMMDGVPVNKSDGGSVNWNMFDMSQIQSIEVVKGPGSSLYGGNAMGGAINIISKRPESKFQGGGSLSYGTYNTMKGNVDLQGRLSNTPYKGFYWAANAIYRKSDGYITQSEEDIRELGDYVTESTVEELGIGAKLGYEINGGSWLELTGNFYDDRRGEGEVYYQPDGNSRDHDTYRAGLNYHGEKESLKWNVNVFYQQEDYKRTSEWIKDDYTFYDVLSERVDLGLLSSLSYDLGKVQNLTLGFDIKQGSVDAEDVYYTSTDIVYNRGSMNFIGVFAQDEFSFFDDKLKVIAGLRFDYAKYFDGSFYIETPSGETTYMASYVEPEQAEDNWNAFSPKLSLLYNVNSKFRIYANYSMGFRPPILDDLCRSGRMRGGFKVANSHLQPEYLTNYEIGSDLQIVENIDASASIYYSVGKDFMYYVNTGDSIDMGYGMRPINKKDNISEVEIYGAEVEFKFDLYKGINLTANYAYSHSEIKDYKKASPLDPVDLTGNHLTDVPNHLISAGLNWYNRFVNFSIKGKYIGEMWVNDLNEFDDMVGSDKYPEYYTFDLRLSKQFKMIKASINVQNVLDQYYYTNKGSVNPGRFITVELGVKF